MVQVRAPATCANLGSGFDVFGIALEEPFDMLEVEEAATTSITVTGHGAETIPTDPSENIAGIVANLLGVDATINIEKGIRPSSGLGSSGASAAGAVVALDQLYNLGVDRNEQVSVAAEAEGVIAGEPHADNVAAAIYGGFVIVDEPAIHSFETDLSMVVCLPDITVSTEEARSVLPTSVTLADHTNTVANAAALTAGMFQADPVLVGEGMEDYIITPRRKQFVPRFDEVCEAARNAGATGVTMSGAGPAVVAVCESTDQSDVATAMCDAFEVTAIRSTAWQTSIGKGIVIQ